MLNVCGLPSWSRLLCVSLAVVQAALLLAFNCVHLRVAFVVMVPLRLLSYFAWTESATLFFFTAWSIHPLQ